MKTDTPLLPDGVAESWFHISAGGETYVSRVCRGRDILTVLEDLIPMADQCADHLANPEYWYQIGSKCVGCSIPCGEDPDLQIALIDAPEFTRLCSALTEAIATRIATCEWRTDSPGTSGKSERWVRDDLCDKWRKALGSPALAAQRAEVIVNGTCVGVEYQPGESVCLLVNRAFDTAKYPFNARWKLTDNEGYEILWSERLEPAELRFQKSLYLNPPAGIGA